MLRETSLLSLILGWTAAGALATYIRVGQSAEVRLPTPQATSCSDLFTIDHEDAYRKQYEGTLVLRPNVTIRYVQMVVQFDRQVEQLTVRYAAGIVRGLVVAIASASDRVRLVYK